VRFMGESRVKYRAEFWGGPLDGEIRPLATLPDVLEVFYGPKDVITDEVTYRRVRDGRANPWRYVFVSQRPKTVTTS
jgi:hypothetical protein